VGAGFPDSDAKPAQVSGGGFQGNDYGGHAPLVGAHVFVLQAGTGGYGAKATSLLSAGETTTSFYGNSYTTALDSVTGSPTLGMYYITTDSKGVFNVSGDYTCTPGLPVYLYASGGNPSTIPAVTLTSVNAVPGTGTYAGSTLVTFQNSGTSLIYQGEQIEFAGITGAFNGFNYTASPTAYTVLSPATFGASQALTINQFTVIVPGSTFAASQSFTGITPAPTAYQSAANAPSNPAVVNIALLGNCGAATVYSGITAIPNGTGTSTYSGISAADLAKLAVGDNFNGPGVQVNGATITNINRVTGTITLNATDTGGNAVTSYNTYVATGATFSSLSFVYMNEVSTVAASTALAPFTAVSSTQNDAVHIGTSSTNLVGLQNAVYNAANLYDIQGSVQGTGGDGETHIAYAVTPTVAAGAVPQALLNSMANVLANCVDSANTYNAATAPGGTASTQCSTYFANATSDGTPTGTVPNDTATASINVARFPGGTTANPNFVSNLFNGLTGNQPFQPSLSSAPHDFAVGILYSAPGSNISDIRADGFGNMWTIGTGSNSVYELAPNGVRTTYSPPSGSTVTIAFQAAMSIDATSTHVYVPAGAGMLVFTPGTTTGALLTAANNSNASAVVGDASGNLYVANTKSNLLTGDPGPENTAYLNKESLTGVAAGAPFPIVSPCTYLLQYIFLDGSYNLWTNNQNTSGNMICRFSSAGALQYSLAIPGAVFPLSYGGAIDAGGNFWFSEKDNSKLYKIAAGTATTGNTACNAAAGCTQATGGTINTPFATAVDGNNTVWITNSGTSPASVIQFSNAGVAITPTFLSGTGYGTNYLYLIVDQSGSLWGASYIGSNIVQYIGIATPTAQPLSYARAAGKLGARP
jgi:hypothetical protein